MEKQHNPSPYSTDPSWGYPVIDREGIDIVNAKNIGYADDWMAAFPIAFGLRSKYYFGSTPLIAAMRCYVARKLGDEIEIPEELL